MVRWKDYLDWLISCYAKKKVKNDVKYLLRIGMYQVCFMKKAGYHVVNETVEFTKRVHGPKVANFVNALLRRLVSEQEALSHRPFPGEIPQPAFGTSGRRIGVSAIRRVGDSTPIPRYSVTPLRGSLRIPPVRGQAQSELRNLSISHSFPKWLVARWLKRFGNDETEKLLRTLNTPPEFGIRVNLDRISVEDAITRLEQKGVAVRKGKFLESALYVDKLGQVLKDDLLAKGLIHVQDEASQLAGAAIGPGSGGNVLDACAGLGTKTGQLSEQRRGSKIIAMDKEMRRLKLVPIGTDLVRGDAVDVPFKDGVFDAILLDAPCSSLGILRKHPEIKWRRKEREIALFGEYQLRLLRSLWRTLKTGAHLVYSVCSFEPEETTSVIERFTKEEGFTLENPLPFLFNKEYFLSLPHETAMDGFFIARLKKI